MKNGRIVSFYRNFYVLKLRLETQKPSAASDPPNKILHESLKDMQFEICLTDYGELINITGLEYEHAEKLIIGNVNLDQH